MFASTFVVLTAHLAIERLGLMTDTNNNSFKARNRTNWIQIVKEFLPELKVDDPYMLKDITKQQLVLHDYLFKKNIKLIQKKKTKCFLTNSLLIEFNISKK